MMDSNTNLNEFLDRITAYENGTMSPGDVPQFLVDLANAGVLRHLQGSYTRAINALNRDRKVGYGFLGGDMIWAVAPSFDEIIEWEQEGGCEAVGCGCWVETDGECPHGNPSWLRYWGMI